MQESQCTKFGLILPYGLGGDGMMGGQTDVQMENNSALAHPYHVGKS